MSEVRGFGVIARPSHAVGSMPTRLAVSPTLSVNAPASLTCELVCTTTSPSSPLGNSLRRSSGSCSDTYSCFLVILRSNNVVISGSDTGPLLCGRSSVFSFKPSQFVMDRQRSSGSVHLSPRSTVLFGTVTGWPSARQLSQLRKLISLRRLQHRP